jgi:hypothetical protein
MTIDTETIEKLITEVQSYRRRSIATQDFVPTSDGRGYGERLIARLLGALRSEHERANEAAEKIKDDSRFISYLSERLDAASARVRELEKLQNASEH